METNENSLIGHNLKEKQIDSIVKKLVGIAILLLICLISTGIIVIRLTAFGVDSVVITDEVDSDGRPIVWESKSSFHPDDRIHAWISTQGTDGLVGMKWFYEDIILYEDFQTTVDNSIGSTIKGPNQPLPSGQYRLEISLGVAREVVETIYFEVEPYPVNPPQPTPVGHIDYYNQPLSFAVPFVFDETWVIDGQEWDINEVKIAVEEGNHVVAVVVGICQPF